MPRLRVVSIAVLLTAACSTAPAADVSGLENASSAPDAQNDAGPSAPTDPGTPAPTSKRITITHPIVPFYQWEANNGYCGEVSMIQAGLRAGQWTSQFYARLLCGAQGNGSDTRKGNPLLQTGPNGFCSAHDDTPDFNAQLLLESAAGANAATCLGNYRLAFTLFDGASAPIGLDGYRSYMSWIKAQTIADHPVTIGLLAQGGEDPQYDHIVSVLSIGTNHDPTDATYYDDDILYFDDHGGTVLRDGKETSYTSIPPGAGQDAKGSTSYIYGYKFSELAKTRDDANADSANPYSILIPGVPRVPTNTGGNGIDEGPPVTGRNYAFAVTGPASTDALLPVRLEITGTTTNGTPNPTDSVAGLQYENPHVGADDSGDACTNDPPASWMQMTFDVTVDGLTAGTSYNLYEYDFDSVSGLGTAAALAVPTSGFNANAAKAKVKTPFVATGTSFKTSVTRSSKTTVIFRAVPASAP